MNAHYHLRALRHIRSSLTIDMATSIAVALVQSRLDYAISLLYRVSTRNIHKLQRCQNIAARLILQQSFTPSIQDLMNQLHWLPIQARIDFKIATLTYKALSSGQTAETTFTVPHRTPKTPENYRTGPRKIRAAISPALSDYG